ncbi:G1/S-specific cyclin-D2-like [Ischnura elegans]|uniref:G1/S-specific cyclin-D2-like n=1 Tax=Ischnura elegans TaxID=197161 RepID=UPI001ED8A7A1|nr:G1/S-specific cyclin-D2-like [Ischnura elegans]
MELLCLEKLNADCRRAERDRVIFEDARVLDNLIDLESNYVPGCDYFQQVQNDIFPYMRNVVSTWMLEVCEEQRCEDQVFPLSTNFLDRFLCECQISRSQLQMVAGVCLLLASKTRQCHPLSVELICHYTDYSVTPDELRHWEILVLSKLQWNATGITGFDFVEHILTRVSWADSNPLIRRHAHTLVSLCYTDPDFIRVYPSVVATACIGAAVRGLKRHQPAPREDEALRSVCALTRVPIEQAEALILRVEALVLKETAVLLQHQAQTAAPSAAGKDAAAAPANQKAPSSPPSPSGSSVADPLEGLAQPETPTDVQDVHF